jgi:signal transduction histidine kinase
LSEDPQFTRLVMLACHDLRTPLATVHGFAHTLARSAELDETSARYVDMISAASGQVAELIDELSVAARMAGGRYDPPLRAVDTLELARTAAERLGEERVGVSGEGNEVELDAEAAERAVAALARCALRHGGFERIELRSAASSWRSRR